MQQFSWTDTPTANSTYKKLAVQCLNEALGWQKVLCLEMANFSQVEKVSGSLKDDFT